jgi:hypothetical protein
MVFLVGAVDALVDVVGDALVDVVGDALVDVVGDALVDVVGDVVSEPVGPVVLGVNLTLFGFIGGAEFCVPVLADAVGLAEFCVPVLDDVFEDVILVLVVGGLSTDLL